MMLKIDDVQACALVLRSLRRCLPSKYDGELLALGFASSTVQSQFDDSIYPYCPHFFNTDVTFKLWPM